LLYAVRDGAIGFASTLPALRAAGVVDAIDPQAVLEFLEFGYVTEDRTILTGAAKLPAASILEWNDGRISERSYWTLPEPSEETATAIGFEEAVEQTEHLLIESVRLRLISDVPAGALLSGGIDSTLVCWALSKLNAGIHAFTVSTPGNPADEAPAAAETARLLGIPHEVVTLDEDRRPLLEDLTAAYGEPFGCSSALAMLQVSRAVKPKATVLLTGDGGDDVFLGYPFYAHYLLAQRVARALPDSAAALWKGARPAASRVPQLKRLVHFLDYATEGLGAVARAHDGLPYYERGGMLGDRLTAHTLQQRQLAGSPHSARRLMAEFLRYQQRMWFASEFLTKVDGGSMHYSLEARSPFLDHRLWELAASLPYQLRLRNGTLKAILREIVRRRVGPQIARRTKQGFTIPVEQWLLSRWRSELDALAGGALLEQQRWIRPGSLSVAVAQAFHLGRAPRQLWFLVTLERWLRANRPGATDEFLAA
jgi:asparagine synthase (glutamine-hydrolysing)